ncbi:MAG: CapA family protein [Clostridiales Family XIII bacterium]|jgi:poly-gamma-glutamate synthesis protein (capsule biosynthesis protein)|nr:CapA family protein [Clostridiales Family XIII bacterium]
MARSRRKHRVKSTSSLVLRLALLLVSVAVLLACVLIPAEKLPWYAASPVKPVSDADAQVDSALPRAGSSAAAAVGKTAEATISLCGDVLLHTTVFKQAKSEGSYDFNPYFSIIKEYIHGDMNIANMEGPVDALGGNQGISSYPAFNAPHEILDALKGAGFTTLLTANNHALDKGFNGLVKNRQNIRDAGLDAVGTFENQTEHDEPFIKSVNGIKIGIAAYTDSTNGIPLPKPYCVDKIDLNSSAVPGILADVERLREAGAEFVMVSLHWGAEYQDAPAPVQKDIAAGLAEGGVDVVIGNHAHCVQPIERIGDCLVIYSLGNFFVDQTPLNRAKTQESMIVNLRVARDAEGIIRLADASYMPTFMYRVTGKSGPDAFRLLPAGAYAEADERPGVFTHDADWNKCKNAWKRVPEIVGDAIRATAESPR